MIFSYCIIRIYSKIKYCKFPFDTNFNSNLNQFEFNQKNLVSVLNYISKREFLINNLKICQNLIFPLNNIKVINNNGKFRDIIHYYNYLITTTTNMSRCLNSSLLSLVAISAGPDNNNSTNIGNNKDHVLQTNTIVVETQANKNMPNQETNKRLDQASRILKNSDIVCFDVDSTVIVEEGIDELAKFCGKGPEVAILTQSAMGGSMTFQDALKIRLDIIRPSQKQIREFLKLYPSTLSPGVKEFINNLRQNGTSVYLISGGFDCLIEPVAVELGIPMSNVFANKLMFYFDGEYAGFDTNQPTSRSGGKGEAISIIRKKVNSDVNITMIGDGATDLEAAPPANHFIGYGGNVVRNEVQARADYYFTDFRKIL